MKYLAPLMNQFLQEKNLLLVVTTSPKWKKRGVVESRNVAFVLVAGGLGERLGYNGIKVALPRETTIGTCFLQHYIESILAIQEASNKLASDGSEKDNVARLALDPHNKYRIQTKPQ